jgi:hypothetical protein
MRYAICFRGISYLKDYHYTDNLPNYTVDFSVSLPNIKKMIIEPIKEKSHTVDFFFSTYDSTKLDYFKSELSPLSITLSEYTQTAAGTPNLVYKGVLESLKMLKEEQEKGSFIYDYVMISRFDMVLFEKIIDIYLPKNAMSVINQGDDGCFLITGDLINDLYTHYIELQKNNISNHQFAIHFKQKGFRVHQLYHTIVDQYKYPFYKATRHFTKGNPHFICEYNDHFNPDSLHYIYHYKPFTEFNSI